MPLPPTPFRCIVALVAAGSLLSVARAQTDPAAAGPASDWRYSLGAGIVSVPRFPGSDRRRTLVVPTFEVEFDDRFFLDPIKGLGVKSDRHDGFGVSAALAVDLASRRRKDDARLRGFDDIVEAPALRLGADWTGDRAFANGEVVSRVGHRNGRGTVLAVEAGYDVIASGRALAGLGVGTRWMEATYARHFFGVTAAQAAASGLPAFDARVGVQSVGVFAQAVVPVGDHWLFFGRWTHERLTNDAARSPITVRRGQDVLLATFSYLF